MRCASPAPDHRSAICATMTQQLGPRGERERHPRSGHLRPSSTGGALVGSEPVHERAEANAARHANPQRGLIHPNQPSRRVCLVERLVGGRQPLRPTGAQAQGK